MSEIQAYWLAVITMVEMYGDFELYSDNGDENSVYRPSESLAA